MPTRITIPEPKSAVVKEKNGTVLPGLNGRGCNQKNVKTDGKQIPCQSEIRWFGASRLPKMRSIY